MAYIGCIAGAVLIRDYERDLRAAGFASVQIVDTVKDLNAYAKVDNQSACCSPTMIALNEQPSTGSCCGDSNAVHDGLADLLKKYNVNDYAASVQVYALKPTA